MRPAGSTVAASPTPVQSRMCRFVAATASALISSDANLAGEFGKNCRCAHREASLWLGHRVLDRIGDPAGRHRQFRDSWQLVELLNVLAQQPLLCILLQMTEVPFDDLARLGPRGIGVRVVVRPHEVLRSPLPHEHPGRRIVEERGVDLSLEVFARSAASSGTSRLPRAQYLSYWDRTNGSQLISFSTRTSFRPGKRSSAPPAIRPHSALVA